MSIFDWVNARAAAALDNTVGRPEFLTNAPTPGELSARIVEIADQANAQAAAALDNTVGRPDVLTNAPTPGELDARIRRGTSGIDKAVQDAGDVIVGAVISNLGETIKDEPITPDAAPATPSGNRSTTTSTSR